LAVGAGIYSLAQRGKSSVTPEGENRVVARVGSTKITQYDVNLAIEKGFSKKSRAVLEGEGRKELVESLIQARAVALAREAELSPLERVELEKLVYRHREELLVKQYLIEHSLVKDLPLEELRKYYDEHIQEFGAAPVRKYELVAAETRPSGNERDTIIRELGLARATPNWFEWTQKLREQGTRIVYYSGDLAGEMMKAQLATVAEPLKPGESSEITMIEGRPHVVRLISETKGTPKPFKSVAAEIRERLAPVVLSRAAKAASAEAMKTVEVVRY